ncbi:WD40-repeat-containing domain protein [Boletus reticuloceps]|uniref:WD40-repeat-containing domain protein n=1 Tax=Boletus reticuloceps TaxID=495285 RepID=A0A8I3A9V8_9AGAM|nr:WD40-repeat-containing domain protein [Boletus reticuloceps]
MTSCRLPGESGTVEINTQHKIFAVLFAQDGNQVLSGGKEGMLRRWRVEDGQEVGEPIRMEGAEICAPALSPDCKWLVCGLRRLGSSDGRTRVRVWDAQTHEKVLDIHGHTNTVFSVDISPDSTKFATGGLDKQAFIHCITTGENLVGPLKHGGTVVAVRFSPDGDRLATATGDKTDTTSVRIYDSDDGQQLLNIPCWFWTCVSSPLAWSADGHQLFAATSGEVKCFDTSSGTLLNKWAAPGARWATSIIIAHNQKFAAAAASTSLFFWDTFTGQQVGSVIEVASNIRSISHSPNDDHIVTGEENGKITIRSLRDILPSSYLTMNLPFLHISEAVFKSWRQGDLTRVEELLIADTTRPSSPLHRAHTLAYHALVRSRSNHWDAAIDGAKKVDFAHLSSHVVPTVHTSLSRFNHPSLVMLQTLSLISAMASTRRQYVYLISCSLMVSRARINFSC